MPKDPLFPHRPKIREPLFPHVPKGQRVERLPQAEIRPEKTTAAFMEIAEWFVKYRRPITVKKMQPVVTKYFPTEKSFIEFLKYLESPKGTNEFRRELRDAMRRHGISIPPEEEWLPQTREEIKHFWVEENKPYGTWAIVEAWPGGTVRSPYPTKEEAIKREEDTGKEYEWNLKQVPSPQEKFPKQHEALKKLYPYIIAEYHGDGDLTVRELLPIKGRPGFNLGRLYVVTTDGEVFEETQLAMILPATRGGPLSKYCCRFSDACAPPELLEEGKFLERISWLRQHYKEKHPGMWGKVGRLPAVTPIEGYYWTAVNKDTGEIVERLVPYPASDKALKTARDWAAKHWKGDTALVEVWRQPFRYSENLKIEPVETLTLGG